MIRLIFGSLFVVALVLLGSGGMPGGEPAQAQPIIEVDLEKVDMQLTPVYTLKCLEEGWAYAGDGLFTFDENMSKACAQIQGLVPDAILPGVPGLVVTTGPIAPPFNGDDDGDTLLDEDPKGDCDGDGLNNDDFDGPGDDSNPQYVDEDDGSVNTLWINCPAKWPDDGGHFIQRVRGFIGVDNDGDTYVDEDGAGRYDFNGDTTVDFADNNLDYPVPYIYEDQYQGDNDDAEDGIDEDPIDCLLEDTVNQSGESLYSECFYQVKQILRNNFVGWEAPVLAVDTKWVDCPDQTTTGADTTTECGVHYTMDDYSLYNMWVSAETDVPMYAKPFNPSPFDQGGQGYLAGIPPLLDCEAPKIPVDSTGDDIPDNGYYFGPPSGLTLYQTNDPLAYRPVTGTRPMYPGDCFMVDSVPGTLYEMDIVKSATLWPGEELTIMQQYVVGCIYPGPHKFLLQDDVWPGEPGYEDIVPDNNYKYTEMLVACTQEAVPGDCPDPSSVPWVPPPGDVDCDGWSSADESYNVLNIGTIPTDACPATGAVSGTPGGGENDEDPDAWPADMNDNQVVNLSDVLFLAPPVFFSIGPNPPYQVRYDLNLDNVINLSDVLHMAPPVFFYACTP